jgi:hypothetical protein
MLLFKAIIYRFVAYQLPYLLLRQDQSHNNNFYIRKAKKPIDLDDTC